MGNGTGATGAQALDAPLHRIEIVLAALVSMCEPVVSVVIESSGAAGCVAAQDVVASRPVPLRDEALIDGCAVNSADLIGASPISPAFAMAEPKRVRVGDPLPPDCDAIIDSALVVGAQEPFEIHGSPAPGEGVRRAGDDFAQGDFIVRAGARITSLEACALTIAGVDALPVRQPRLRMIVASNDANVRASASLIGALVMFDCVIADQPSYSSVTLEGVVKAFDGEWDASFVIGGAGGSESDYAVDALRSCGSALAHGFALDAGRTGAAGCVKGRPVICLPGRFESAVGVYLALGRPLLRLLAGASPPPLATQALLARKIASSVGVAQLAFLRLVDGKWAPLAVGDLTLAGLIRSDAYLIIPEASEGFADGAMIQPFLMPGRSERG